MLYSNFVGRIGKDGCKVIAGKNGQFLTMDVATDFYSKGENKTQWIRVRSSKANHIKLAQYLTKGKLILIQGMQLEDSRWIGKDGEAHSQHVIIADSIDFISVGKKKDSPEDTKTDTRSHEEAETKQVPETPFPAPVDNSEDLPF